MKTTHISHSNQNNKKLGLKILLLLTCLNISHNAFATSSTITVITMIQGRMPVINDLITQVTTLLTKLAAEKDEKFSTLLASKMTSIQEHLTNIVKVVNEINQLLNQASQVLQSIDSKQIALNTALNTPQPAPTGGLLSSLFAKAGTLLNSLPFGGLLGNALSSAGQVMDSKGSTVQGSKETNALEEDDKKLEPLIISLQNAIISLKNSFINCIKEFDTLYPVAESSTNETIKTLAVDLEHVTMSAKDTNFFSLDDSFTSLSEEINKLITALNAENQALHEKVLKAKGTNAQIAATAEQKSAAVTDKAVNNTVNDALAALKNLKVK